MGRGQLGKRLLAATIAGFLFSGPAGAAESLDAGEDFALEIHKPDGPGPYPTVLLLHGCAGLTPAVHQGLRDHAAFLAAAGYLAAILDSFGRRGRDGGRVCRSLEELGYARHYRVQDVARSRDILAALPEVDARNFFVIGQSNGGSVALALAAGAGEANGTGQDDAAGAPAFQAIVAYYPWCGAISAAPTLVAPLLVLGAGDDDWVSPEGCRQRAAKAEGAAMEVVVYDGAHHSFDLPIERQVYEGHVVAGDEDATRDSRARILDFFARHRQP
ncbi:MAG TPA: dienelactone hydrolase family protein [Kiloniellaceae bacterium]|nr:dienelactone hydrolase family protein [Kiloniellaceae bacterium]